MITPSTIYWLTRLDGIHRFVDLNMALPVLVAVFGLAVSLILLVMSYVTGNGTFDMFDGKSDKELDDAHSEMRRWSRRSLKTGVIGVAVSVALNAVMAFVPTSKEMAAIIVIPKIANSESVQQLGDGIVDLAKQWLTELAPKKGEAK